MKSALANYKFTKVLHKKDMTKSELERFFSIELRDQVKNNNVNSLLIWYAGHVTHDVTADPPGTFGHIVGPELKPVNW